MDQLLIFVIFAVFILIQALARMRKGGPQPEASDAPLEPSEPDESTWQLSVEESPRPIEQPPRPITPAPLPIALVAHEPSLPVAPARPAPAPPPPQPKRAVKVPPRSADPWKIRLVPADRPSLQRAIALMAVLGPPRCLDQWDNR